MDITWARDWVSISDLEAAIRAWVDRYSNERPHQTLDWRAPAQQRALNPNSPLDRSA